MLVNSLLTWTRIDELSILIEWIHVEVLFLIRKIGLTIIWDTFSNNISNITLIIE